MTGSSFHQCKDKIIWSLNTKLIHMFKLFLVTGFCMLIYLFHSCSPLLQCSSSVFSLLGLFLLFCSVFYSLIVSGFSILHISIMFHPALLYSLRLYFRCVPLDYITLPLILFYSTEFYNITNCSMLYNSLLFYIVQLSPTPLGYPLFCSIPNCWCTPFSILHI